jgi:hypothetical protein
MAQTERFRRGLDLTLVVLLVTSLLTPWSSEIRVAHQPRTIGLTLPVAWLVAATIGAARLRIPRRYAGLALGAAAAGLAGWLAWVSWRLSTPDFRHLAFTFLPVDVLGYGWYLGLAAWALALYSLAVSAEDEPRPATLWSFALVPGMGLLRMGEIVRGRAWLVAVALIVVFLQLTGVQPEEFQYYADVSRSTPPDRSRLLALVLTSALVLTWAASILDTLRAQRQLGAGAGVLKPLAREAGRD